MKPTPLPLLLLLPLSLGAQLAVPATPGKFKTRTINGDGGGVSVQAGVTTTPAAPSKARLVSYFSLSETRQWKSGDGRSLLGSVIAFEDAVVEIEAASAAAAKEAAQKAPAPAPPEKPTLLRDGKVRLLVNNKPFEVPLERLSAEDRKFIEDLNARLPK